MKLEKRYEEAEKLIELINTIPGNREKFTVLITTLTMFFVSQDPQWDILLNGLENELKRIVKAQREALKKVAENEDG